MEQINARNQSIDEGLREHPAKKGLLFNIAVTALEVGGAILIFQLARNAGATDVEAYLLGSIAPVLGALAVWARSRKFSGASAAIFAFTALSAAVALIGSTDSKVLLYKDCAVTGIIGLIFGLSCVVLPRPVLFYFAQRYGTDGTKDGMSVFDQMWNTYPTFRRSLYQMSLVWAAVFIVQAAVTALIIRSTPFSTAYNWDQILPIVAFVLAGFITFLLVARARKAGRARAAAAELRG